MWGYSQLGDEDEISNALASKQRAAHRAEAIRCLLPSLPICLHHGTLSLLNLMASTPSLLCVKAVRLHEPFLLYQEQLRYGQLFFWGALLHGHVNQICCLNIHLRFGEEMIKRLGSGMAMMEHLLDRCTFFFCCCFFYFFFFFLCIALQCVTGLPWKCRKAEEKFPVRNDPLGMDRRYNKYWRFPVHMGANSTDPGAGRLYIEFPEEGKFLVVDNPETFNKLLESLERRGPREGHLHVVLNRQRESIIRHMPAPPMRCLPNPPEIHLLPNPLEQVLYTRPEGRSC